MRNTHNQFLQFERAISFSPAKTKKLIASRKALENRIREHFKSHVKFLTPRFYIQGSYKMGTMVVKKNGQLMRLVKYFKAWVYQRSRKMPNGISFMVWVVNNYKPDNRDDKAFFETAKTIESTFGGFWNGDTEVINPAPPQDNLLKLDFDQRTKFKEVFRPMLNDAEQAIQTNSNQKALNIWKHLFGDNFPVI